jgi:hypothetical protein
VGQERQRWGLRSFLLGAEVPADQRAHAEHLEEVPGDLGHAEHLGALAQARRQRSFVEGSDSGENVRALAELEQSGPGVAEGASLVVELDLVHADQALRGPEGQGPDQRRVEHRVDGGVEPDPQREGEDDDRGEARPREQRPDSGAEA